jgi:transposase InsO family protein
VSKVGFGVGFSDATGAPLARIWETHWQAETAIFQYINGFYNAGRRHSALGEKSPLAFEREVA